MAKCPNCQRELPLSGKCPFCQKISASGGFSLKGLLSKASQTSNGTTNPSISSPTSSQSQQIANPTGLNASGLANTSPTTIQVKEQPEPTSISNEQIILPNSPNSAQNSIQTDSNDGNHSQHASEGATISPGTSSYTPETSTPIMASLRARAGLHNLGSAGLASTPMTPSVASVSAPKSAPLVGEESVTPSSSGSIPPHSIESSFPLGNSENSFQEASANPASSLPKSEKELIKRTLDIDTGSSTVKTEETGVFSSQATGFGDEEMECAVLAGLLNDNYILDTALSKGLVVELFSNKYSRAVCKAILSLREENREASLIDKIIIKNKLKQMGLFDLPMQTFLNRIMAQPCPTLDQVLHYMELMKDQALKRRLKEISQDIIAYIESPEVSSTSIETFTNRIIQELRNVQKAKTSRRISLIKEEMKEIIRDIDQREVTGEVEIIGFSFEPFHYLNVALSGFRKGFMYAIAGAPRRGKTTFTLELATAVATNCKIPVLFFTYEQTKKNLTYRLLAKESRLNPDSLQRKKIRSDMIMEAKFMGGWKKMQSYMDYFYIIEATKADTVDRIRSYAYNVMQDFNTEDIMIFIDYIQKMPLARNYNDEKFKVEEISTELKALSIELNNPIMTISSLSKEGCMIDAAPNAERPTMYHCKGSGDLEYDLDCAMIQAKDWGDTKELHAQLQHKAEQMGKDSTRVPKVDVVNLYLDKNRDAPEGIYSVMQYLFFIEDNKFIELGPKYEDDRYRFSKIESLVDDLIQRNYIVFYDRDRDSQYHKGRVQIKLKNF